MQIEGIDFDLSLSYQENENNWIDKNKLYLDSKVLIAYKPSFEFLHKYFSGKWTEEMDKWIGCTAKIAYFYEDGRGIELERFVNDKNKELIFPYFCLEKIEEEKNFDKYNFVTLSNSLTDIFPYLKFYINKQGFIYSILKNGGYLIKYDNDAIIFIDFKYKKFINFVCNFSKNELVLVRNDEKDIWTIGIFYSDHGPFMDDANDYGYYILNTGGGIEKYTYCISYKDNECFCGTSKQFKY